MKPIERWTARSLSFAIGLLSLGAETLWVRTYSFLSKSTPKSVAIVLGAYLLGIALGAVIGARFCQRQKQRLPEILAATILGASAIILVSPFVLSWTVRLWPVTFFANIFPAILAFLPALVFSICFPICHHIGTALEPGQIGKSMSKVYAANIAGSAIGPLLLNFGILQFATTQLAFALLGLLGVGIGIVYLICLKIRPSNKVLAASGFASAALAAVCILASIGSNNWLIESLSAWKDRAEVRRVVETRQGIVVSYRDEKLGDMITGGNVYDGRANVDPRLNSNNINRILVLSALRPKPRRVLVIGLSIGSWLYLITGFAGVEHIDVVEINPGYLDLMRDYQKQNAALGDPRVRLHITDGRKFLRGVAPESYDLVVMNNTLHWRAYSTLLLSKEFLALIRSRMASGGLLAFNTTGSPDALHTANSVFPFAYLYENFAICSDFDWRQAFDRPASIDAMLGIAPQGAALLTAADRPLATQFLSTSYTAILADIAAKTGRPLEVITDRNLITEYRYGR